MWQLHNRHTDSSRSEYSHPHRNHRFPPPHLRLHVHVSIQQRALSRPSHPSPFTAQIWDLQCVLVYRLLLSDAELSLLRKLRFNCCVQARSHDDCGWGEYMETTGWNKASQLCVFIWEESWGRRGITLLMSIQRQKLKNEKSVCSANGSSQQAQPSRIVTGPFALAAHP